MIDLRSPLAVLATRIAWDQIEVVLAPKFEHEDRAGSGLKARTCWAPQWLWSVPGARRCDQGIRTQRPPSLVDAQRPRAQPHAAQLWADLERIKEHDPSKPSCGNWARGGKLSITTKRISISECQ